MRKAATSICICLPLNPSQRLPRLPPRSFIGVVCGLFAYFLNYPSVFAYDSAYPKRRGQAAVTAAARRRTGLAAAATRSSSGGGADPEALAATAPGQKLYTEAEVAAMYGMPLPGTYSRRL